jgi:hypothetical protein
MDYMIAVTRDELRQIGRADEHGITDILTDRAITRAQAFARVCSYYQVLGLHGPNLAEIDHILNALFD